MFTPDTLFLDRDGVINADSPDYIKSRDEFHPLPGSLTAIARITRCGCRVIVITNQSAINRGMIAEAELAAIHTRLHQAVEALGGRITDIVYCPHRPDEGCDCRKPKPGMIIQASHKHGIDLLRSVMVGDSAKDILAGKAAGCACTILVKTGDWQTAIATLTEKGALPDHVAGDLEAAVAWILEHSATGAQHHP